MYADCGEKYRLAKIEQVPQAPAMWFIGGRAFHEAVEYAEREGLATDPQAVVQEVRGRSSYVGPLVAEGLRLLEAGVEEAGGPEEIQYGGRRSREWPNGEDVDWWRLHLPVFLRRYLTVRMTDADRGWEIEPGGVEKKILSRLPGIWVEFHLEGATRPTYLPVQIVGYLDAWMIRTLDRETGEIAKKIRDYKTGSSFDVNVLQYGTYGFLLETIGEDPPEIGETVFVRATRPETILRQAPIRRASTLIPEMYRVPARGLIEGHYPIHPSWQCKSCFVRQHCRWWQATGGAEE